MAGIRVHGTRRSSSTLVVLAVLHELNLDYDLINVDLMSGAHKQLPYLSLNPFGLIPAFEDGNVTLFESRAIARYVATKYGGEGLVGEGEVEQWREVEALHFNPSAKGVMGEVLIKPIKGGCTDRDALKGHMDKIQSILAVYEDRLSKCDYLGGDAFSLADLQHMPCMHYLLTACKLPNLLDSKPNVKAWWTRISSRPSWVALLSQI